ncbi:hypothetical protein G3I19_35270, partial [Streptomyces sp. SID10853]|uniref:hypothetical protein n=1 Tax=Streptomyces sp. SID10853 TaxID=2706028 RepID=UPI0013BF304E
MGFLDRFRGRTDTGPASPARTTAAPAAPAPPAPAAVTPDVVGASGHDWNGLPAIQRATQHTAGHAVATADFSSRLATWQNPSFSGSLSHAVL